MQMQTNSNKKYIKDIDGNLNEILVLLLELVEISNGLR